MNQNKTIATLSIVLLIVSVGCDRFETSYGISKGKAGRTSVNGFGALRSTYEAGGYQTRDMRRLSDRVKRSQTIVWTPQVPTGINKDVTSWFENWLRRGKHTLVYVLPDSGSESDYWTLASQSATPEQRLEYRRRSARKKNERIQWNAHRNNIPSNGWFVAKPKVQLSSSTNLSNQNWSSGRHQSASASGDSQSTRTVRTEYILQKYERPSKKNAAKKGTVPAVPPAVNQPVGPVGPGGVAFDFGQNIRPTSTKIEFTPLLKSDAGDTIVAEVTNKYWGDSRIIVVAGGSLLTNFSFTQESNVEIAAELVAFSKGDVKFPESKTRNSPIAGFMTTRGMPSVSNTANGLPQAVGAKLLLVWPIGLITVHAVLLALVFCASVFPIFGRARSVDRGTNRSAGSHLDAVASLMNLTRGENYARVRISEYMRRMKGETEGKWVLPEKRKPGSGGVPKLGEFTASQILGTPPPGSEPRPSDDLKL